MSDERTVASMESGEYNRRLASISDGLRRLADEVDREGKPADHAAFGGTRAHVWSAHNVLHSVFWGVANLHLDALVDAAGRADSSAQEEEE